MSEVTRGQHLQWCKDRAYEYIERGDIPGAWGSFVSDMGKHEETAGHMAIDLGNQLLFSGHNNTPEEMRRFIEGFN